MRRPQTNRTPAVKHEDKRAAITAFRERKPAIGIYAVRCAASGQTWVGRTPNLESVRNRLWFTLRQGANPHRSLQAAWRAHGADAFSFEVLHRLKDDTPTEARDRILKERLAHWRTVLQAERI